MNAIEQMFAIPTESDSYKFGFGYCPEGGEGGNWMYVKGIDYEGQSFEHWAFMRHHEIKLFDTNSTQFFKTYRGIKEVVEIKRELAWRVQKSQYRMFGA